MHRAAPELSKSPNRVTRAGPRVAIGTRNTDSSTSSVSWKYNASPPGDQRSVEGKFASASTVHFSNLQSYKKTCFFLGFKAAMYRPSADHRGSINPSEPAIVERRPDSRSRIRIVDSPPLAAACTV